VRFGVLDSAPVRDGGTTAGALTECLDRARRLEDIGCHRLWFTEHHLAPDVASCSPLVLAGQAATRTRRMRLGAGGVMTRNQAPLIAAEQLATLSQLHPGRIDLGLGRSGGSDRATDARIRRTTVEYTGFEPDVRETLHHLDHLRADGVQVFVLAASGDTAGFAGRLGAGLAVAGHVAPAGIDAAVSAYRATFRSGSAGDRPRVVLCLPVLVARTDDEAAWWFRSVQQRYLDRLRTGGAPMRPPDAVALDWSASERYRVTGMLGAAVIGSEQTVGARLQEICRRWNPDEVMAMTDLPDADITMRSHARLTHVLAHPAPDLTRK
jgi:luciferase family oxidoreductase group 1